MATDTKEFTRQLDAIMVRRLKSELPKDDFGQERFPKRVLEALEVDYPAEEKRIHAALKRYAELRQAKPGPREKFATDFVLLVLKQRLFSSPAAFLRTLEQHKSVAQERPKTTRCVPAHPGHPAAQIDRVEEDYSVDDEADLATHEALDAAKVALSANRPPKSGRC